jgi:hypothetical protein
MGRVRDYKTINREEIVRLLSRLPRVGTARQLRTASALAWLGIRARKRDIAVRGRLNTAARGRVGATHFVPALKVLPALPTRARREMALALGDLAGGVAVNDVARLAKAPETETRLIAVDALGKIGGPQAVSVLKKAVGDVNETVRAEAVRSLGQLAVKEARKDPAGLKEAAVEDLVFGVIAGDPSEYVREVAGEAATAIREAKALQTKARTERTPSPAVSVSV